MAIENYYFICNPASNTGRLKKRWTKLLGSIEEKINGNEFEWRYTDGPLHAIDLVPELVNQGYKNIISVGGDGIANEVLNGILRNNLKDKVNFGFLPMGTSNDAHKTYEYPSNIMDSLNVILNRNIKNSPVGKITGDFGPNPYYILDHVDCGLAAIAAKSSKEGSKILKGEMKYTYHALKQLTKFKKNKGKVTVDGEEYYGNFSIIAVSLGKSMGGYLLWPDNNVSLGDFAVLIGREHSRFELLKLMIAAEKGEHIYKKGIEYRRGKIIEIELEKPWPYQAEGEIFTEGSKYVKIEYLENAVKLFCPN